MLHRACNRKRRGAGCYLEHVTQVSHVAPQLLQEGVLAARGVQCLLQQRDRLHAAPHVLMGLGGLLLDVGLRHLQAADALQETENLCCFWLAQILGCLWQDLTHSKFFFSDVHVDNCMLVLL